MPPSCMAYSSEWCLTSNVKYVWHLIAPSMQAHASIVIKTIESLLFCWWWTCATNLQHAWLWYTTKMQTIVLDHFVPPDCIAVFWFPAQKPTLSSGNISMDYHKWNALSLHIYEELGIFVEGMDIKMESWADKFMQLIQYLILVQPLAKQHLTNSIWCAEPQLRSYDSSLNHFSFVNH